MPIPLPREVWGISEEEAYAGPAEMVKRQSGKPPTEQKRLRRAHGTDEAHPPREEGGLLITGDRVGTIPLPRLPALFYPLIGDHPLYASAEKVRSHAYTTLDQHGVRWESCAVGHRAWRFDRRELDQLPIAIVMWVSREGAGTDYPLNSLKAICREVRRYAEKTFNLAMNVEIADPGTVRAPASFPLFPTDPIVLGWSKIRSSLLSILVRSQATSMKPIRRGKGPDALDNPQTIFISIPEDSTQDWRAIRDQIVVVLDRARLPSVAVEVSRGTSSLQASGYHGTPLPDEVWGKTPISGVSIGSHGWESASSSTLGGFIELRDKYGTWIKYGVTCYHNVIPPKPADGFPLGSTELHRWHDNGMSPEETRGRLVGVSQPSLQDRKSALRYLTNECQAAEDEIREIAENWYLPNIPYGGTALDKHRDAEQNLKLSKERLTKAERGIATDDSFIGHVWAGSGFQISAEKKTLDWALIELEAESPALNQLPARWDLPVLARRKYNPPSTTMFDLKVITRIDKGTIVFKHGRTTGGTMGILNPIGEYTFEDKVYTQLDGTPRRVFSCDWLIVGPPMVNTMFADVGDSGAFIVDHVGALVGMVVSVDYGASCVRFTATRDLFDSILEVTQMYGIRLPPA